MKKIVILLLLLFIIVGCKKNDKVEDAFMKNLTDAKSYKVTGVMETFYGNDRRQNEFVVFYKEPDLIKVTITSVENEDKQIILKNKTGVFVLIPSVNKKFKIQSSWPSNASYPYLLQSLAKDIANDENLIRNELESTIEIETKTHMHTDANVVKQKIIFDKDTQLPTEVKVYDDEGELYIRCVFQSIELDYNVNDSEFVVDDTMTQARLEFGEDGKVFSDRTLAIPTYFPDGSKLDGKIIGSERAIMKFTGDYGFTIIQELIEDSEAMSSEEEDGSVVMILGNVGFVTDKYLRFIYGGVSYTLASEEIKLDELVKIVSSYIIDNEK